MPGRQESGASAAAVLRDLHPVTRGTPPFLPTLTFPTITLLTRKITTLPLQRTTAAEIGRINGPQTASVLPGSLGQKGCRKVSSLAWPGHAETAPPEGRDEWQGNRGAVTFPSLAAALQALALLEGQRWLMPRNHPSYPAGTAASRG